MANIREHMALSGNGILRKKYNLSDCDLIAALDECGRGCLFGPVVSCAIIIDDNFNLPEINDSKKVTPKNRKLLSEYIKNNCLSYSITEVDNNIIDDINILQATMLSMNKCIKELSIVPDHIFVDGNYYKDILKINIPFTTIIKGDAIYQSIAAASILAKVYRDELLENLSEKYIGYDLFSNKGYGTKKHIDGIKKHGLTDLHRKSFNINLNN